MRTYRADERGRTELSWLDSRHTFSFGEYDDPERTGFGPLRVVNDDRVAAAGGFATHPHRDMEILTYVVDGAVAHRDSMGHTTTVAAGEVQLMSAGSGVTHSEFNPSKSEAARFLQIWIVPRTRGGEPRYQQRRIDWNVPADWVLLASAAADGDAVLIDQDVAIRAARVGNADSVSLDVPAGRHGWLQVVAGRVRVTGGTDGADRDLGEGDALSWEQRAGTTMRASGDAELLHFDLP